LGTPTAAHGRQQKKAGFVQKSQMGTTLLRRAEDTREYVPLPEAGLRLVALAGPAFGLLAGPA
jgi:hypothetical protein